MKKIILTGALLTSFTMGAMAQDQSAQTPANMQQPGAPQPHAMPQMPTPESMAERRTKMYQEKLALTPEQYKSAYAAELESAKLMMQVKNGGPRPSPEQIMQSRTDKDNKYKAILTPEQWAKYDAMRPHPAPAGGAAPPPPPPPPPAK